MSYNRNSDEALGKDLTVYSVAQYTQSKPWNAYPIRTKVYAVSGGYWEKVQGGFKWCTGSTFGTPGGDWSYIVEPIPA